MPGICTVIGSEKERLDALEAAKKALLEGGLVIFPTETVYGLFFTEKGRKKAYELKKRDLSKPCAVHLGSFERLYSLTGEQSEERKAFIESRLPGPYTLLFPVEGGGRLGIRYPACKPFCRLAESISENIYGTSANYSGEKNPMTLAQTQSLWQGVAVAVDGGILAERPSKVLDLACEPPAVLRP